jgi:hypothetical protein
MTKIVAFAGRKQSGKSSAAEFTAQEYSKKHGEVSAIYNFADPLKQLCIDILGLEHHQCYGTDEEKNELVDCYWNDKQLSGREVMQIVGTEWFRTMQHNVWADATIRNIQDEGLPLALIADCRFPNEVEAVKKAGGIVIKLNRDLYKSDHASETALDRNNYDELNFDGVIQSQYMDIEAKNETLLRILTQKGIL